MDKPCFELKGSLFTLTVLQLFEDNLSLLEEQLKERIKMAPGFFNHTPLVIDLHELPKDKQQLDFFKLRELLLSLSIIPVGVKGAKKSIHTQLEAAGMAILAEAKTPRKKAPEINEQKIASESKNGAIESSTSEESSTSKESSTSEESSTSKEPSTSEESLTNKEPSANKESLTNKESSTSEKPLTNKEPSTKVDNKPANTATETTSSPKSASSDLSNRAAKIVKQTIRSGQQIYAPGGDLVVIGSVSTGAEILADGNIHVYGTLRGRALAGVQGNQHASIFCHSLQAELISIAGIYLLSDDIVEDKIGASVQVYMENEKLQMELI